MARNQTWSLGHLLRMLDKKMPDHLDLETLLKVPHLDPDLGFDISPYGSIHLQPGGGHVPEWQEVIKGLWVACHEG